MARFVDQIQGFTNYQQGITINVGKISGGIGKNTVPDVSEALVDLRFIADQDNDAIRPRIEEAARKSAVSGTHIDIQWGPGRYPMVKTDASETLRSQYAQCQHLSGLGNSESELVGGGSDAATTSHLGIPSIDGLGPRGKGFHTTDEFIELESMIPKTQALLRFLTQSMTSLP